MSSVTRRTLETSSLRDAALVWDNQLVPKASSGKGRSYTVSSPHASSDQQVVTRSLHLLTHLTCWRISLGFWLLYSLRRKDAICKSQDSHSTQAQSRSKAKAFRDAYTKTR